jgi:hypothetical protein
MPSRFIAGNLGTVAVDLPSRGTAHEIGQLDTT